MTGWACNDPQRKAVMLKIFIVRINLAKTVFQAHGTDASGWAVLCKKLGRDQMLAFYSQRQACIVAMKACGGSHYWVRKIGQLGHDVRLVPPA